MWKYLLFKLEFIGFEQIYIKICTDSVSNRVEMYVFRKLIQT